MAQAGGLLFKQLQMTLSQSFYDLCSQPTSTYIWEDFAHCCDNRQKLFPLYCVLVEHLWRDGYIPQSVVVKSQKTYQWIYSLRHHQDGCSNSPIALFETCEPYISHKSHEQRDPMSDNRRGRKALCSSSRPTTKRNLTKKRPLRAAAVHNGAT